MKLLSVNAKPNGDWELAVEHNNSSFQIVIPVDQQTNITSLTDLQAYFANLFPAPPTWLQNLVGSDL